MDRRWVRALATLLRLDQFFTGTHESLTQAYSPMTIRFFILQAHYRGSCRLLERSFGQ